MSAWFECCRCGFVEEYRDRTPSKCPKCDLSHYILSYTKRQKVNAEDHPRWSDALGVNPNQIPAFKRRFPYMEFDPEGRCLVRNRQEKKRILKDRGYVELD